MRRLVIQQHPYSAVTDLGRKFLRCLARHLSSLLGVGAPDKPGAVHWPDLVEPTYEFMPIKSRGTTICLSLSIGSFSLAHEANGVVVALESATKL